MRREPSAAMVDGPSAGGDNRSPKQPERSSDARHQPCAPPGGDHRRRPGRLRLWCRAPDVRRVRRPNAAPRHGAGRAGRRPRGPRRRDLVQLDPERRAVLRRACGRSGRGAAELPVGRCRAPLCAGGLGGPRPVHRPRSRPPRRAGRDRRPARHRRLRQPPRGRDPDRLRPRAARRRPGRALLHRRYHRSVEGGHAVASQSDREHLQRPDADADGAGRHLSGHRAAVPRRGLQQRPPVPLPGGPSGARACLRPGSDAGPDRGGGGERDPGCAIDAGGTGRGAAREPP